MSPVARRTAGWLGILLAGFAWGFLTQREKIFPHSILRRIAVKAGVRLWKKPPRVDPPAPFAGVFSIPYVNGQVDPHPGADGVVVNRVGRAAPGYNFFSMPGRPTAYLIDQGGKVLWRWSLSSPCAGTKDHDCQIAFTHLYPNGSVLALVERHALLKLDKDSHVLWRYDEDVHHDAWACPDGRVYSLVRRKRFDPAIRDGGPLLADSIVVLSPDGRPEEEIPLLEALESSPYAFLLPKPPRAAAWDTRAFDVLHTNHVEVFDGSLERLSPLYRRGNILVSFRDICSIAILDGATHRVLWLWGPTNLAVQHHSSILSNGDVLVFDNRVRRSRVLEVDPRTNAIVWRYDPADRNFFSSIRGSCQRLSNGDTLIGVSQPGYAIEVTHSGKVVWKFINPDIGRNHFRQAIFRIVRFDPGSLRFLSSPASR